MANGFGSLYIGASGLQSSQNALNTTANNLANVNTTGYVREQVRFADKSYLKLKDTTITTNAHQSGLGVSIGDVVHARDIFLDKAFRQESGRQSFYEVCYTSVSEVIDMFQELDGEEFKNSLTDLYTALEEFSKDPVDTPTQSLLIQKADLFTTRCMSLYSDLQSYQSNLNDQIKDDVNRINEIGNEIYKLNLQIQKVESGGIETAMEMRDQRDNLLDELATYGAIEITEDATGFVYVDFERQRFVDDNRCYNIAMQTAKGTGFVTPYWPQLTNKATGEITEVFRTNVDISPEYNNDIGGTKAKLIARGTTYGRYYDIEDPDRYKKVEDCVVMETEAELDKLFHTMVTQMNDLFCPNIEGTSALTGTTADGTTIELYPAGAVMPDGTISTGYKILDVENCLYGIDGELPPQELFSRMGCERYTEITGADGNTYYVYNEEQMEDSTTLYSIGNVEVNSALMKQCTLLPTYKDNPAKVEDPAVDMDTAQKLVDLWNSESISFNPNDSYPCQFGGFYDKLISKLSVDGNVYYNESLTLADSATSIDNQRTQITGVSSDEELTKLIKYQSAYNAASRYITVISEMTELIVTGLK